MKTFFDFYKYSIQYVNILIYTFKIEKERKVIESLLKAGVTQEGKIYYFGELYSVLFQMKQQILGIFTQEGLQVANEEEEKARWRMQIGKVNIREGLKKKGIHISKDGDNIYIESFDIQVLDISTGEKKLRDFPNIYFNTSQGIGDSNGRIYSEMDFREMLTAIGFHIVDSLEDLEQDALDSSISEFHTEVKYTCEQVCFYALKSIINPEILDISQCDFTDSSIKNRDTTKIVAEKEQIEEEKSHLEKAGIIEENGIWYFCDAKGRDNWPRIHGKDLRLFPSKKFNIKHKIGDKQGCINSISELKKMFSCIGLQVASDKEEIVFLSKKILGIKDILQTYGLIYIPEKGIWITEGLQTKKLLEGVEIGEYKLRYFYGKDFLVRENISPSGELQSKQHVINLLVKLGFSIASEKDIHNFWKEKIVHHKSIFESLGLELGNNNTTWYMGDYIGGIQQGAVPRFISNAFLKRNHIGCERGYLRNLDDIRELLELVGFSIATERQEKIRWQGILVRNMKELKKVGIIYDIASQTWFLDNIENVREFRKIQLGNRKAASFPSQNFNRRHGYGKDGELQTKSDLRAMFCALECKIAGETEIISRYKNIVLEYAAVFDEIGIHIHSGGMYEILPHKKSVASGSKILGRNLNSFPYKNFNTKYKIGDTRGILKSRGQLIQLLELLGFSEYKSA